jgi:hypothetical protein
MPSKKKTTAKRSTTRKRATKKPAKSRSTPPKKVGDLKGNSANPRKEWKAEQREKFKESLRQFGDLSGIIYNRTTGHLVGGHKRVDEFRDNKDAVLTIDERLKTCSTNGTLAYGHVTIDGARFAYREVQWDAKTETAANLAANKWGAAWEWEGVSDMLSSLNEGGFDLELTGFDESEFGPLIAADWSPPEAGELPGEPEPKGEHENHDSGTDTHHVTLDSEALSMLSERKASLGCSSWTETIKRVCGEHAEQNTPEVEDDGE